MLRRRRVKKPLMIALALMMVLALALCGFFALRARAAGNTVSVSSISALLEEINGATSDPLEITLTAKITISDDQTLDGTDKDITILRGATGNMFSVSSGATLTLVNITIDGGSGAVSGYGALAVSGTLEMSDGVTIQNNVTTGGSAGGVGIFSGGELIMTGGSITGNSDASNGGGGVYMSGGTVTMSGGSITGNSTTMNGGGGVYVGGGTFNMSGGSITGNTTTRAGGGVYVYGGTFKMTGGTISDNASTATGNNGGGGVHMTNSGMFTMEDGSIMDNTAASGGGVYMTGGAVFTMTGGTISGNEATATTETSGGGGVYNGGSNSSKFIMSGGTITGNTTAQNGGGVYQYGDSAKVYFGGTAVVSENHTTTDVLNNTQISSTYCIALGGDDYGVAPATGMRVGITGSSNAAFMSSGASAGDEAYFTSDIANLAVEHSESQLRLVPTVATSTLDIEQPTLTYNGTEQTPTFTVIDWVTELTENTHYTVTATAQTNAGTYSATITGLGKYTGTKDVTYTIAQRDLSNATIAEITATTYTGAAQTPTPTVTDSVTITASDYSVAYSSNTNAGTATVTLTGQGNYTGTATATFTINSATLTVTAEDASITYNEEAPAYTYTITGFVNNEDASIITGTPTLSSAYTQGNDVGSYTITPSVDGLSAPNYTFTPATGTLTVTQANQAALTITNPGGKTYGDTGFTLVVNGGSGDGAISYSSSSEAILSVNSGGTVTIIGAGTATITATKAASTNYVATSATVEITVAKASQSALAITNPGTITYGDGTVTLAATGGYGTGAVSYSSNNEVVLTISGSTATITGAGTVTITATKAGDDNYNASNSDSITITVSPRNISNVDVDVTSAHTYTGAAQTPTYDVTDSDGENAIAITSSDYTAEITNNTGAGEEATITLTGLGNYTGTKTEYFTIEKADQAALTLTNPGNKTYGGAAFILTPAEGGSGTGGLSYTSSDSTILSISDDEVTILKVGAASITATRAGDDNYNPVDSNAVEITVAARDIANAAISISGTYIYTGTAQTPTYTVTDSGATITASDYTAAYSANINAGEGATITLTGQGNYSGTKTEYFTIAKATLTVTADDKTITYLDDVPTYTATITGYVNGQNATTASVTGNPAFTCEYTLGTGGMPTGTPATDAGSYPITVANDNLTAANYDFTFVSGTLTVNKKAQDTLTLTDPGSKTYGDGTFTLSATGGSGTGGVTYASSDSTVLSISGTTATINGAGTATITATKAADTNYTIKSAEPFSITVAPRSISGATITVSGTYIYTGQAQTPTYTVTVGGVTLTRGTDYTAAYFDNTDVGTEATIALTGTDNYSGTESATFAIAEKALTITADNKSVIYGDAAPSYTATYSGFVEGESASNLTGSLALNCDYEVNDAATTYEITPSGFTSNNYAITYTKGTLTVSKRALSNVAIATIDDVDYQGAAYTPTPSVTDSGATLAASDYTISYANNTNAGTATFMLTATASGNYSGTKSVNFTINTVPLAITADDKSITYGSAVPTYTVSYNGFVGGEGAGVLGGELEFDCTYAQNSSVGDYTITPSGLTSSNYVITFETGTLTIGKRALSNVAIADIDSVTYSGAAYTPTPSVTDTSATLAASDYTVSYTNNTNAGTATITLTAEEDGNYSGEATKTFTIAEKALTITADNKSITYGDAVPAYTTTYSGFVEGEDASNLTGSLLLDCDYEVNDAATTYDITPSGFTSNNYAITYTKGTLTVSKRALSNVAIATIDDVAYQGAACTPTPSVTDSGATLAASDYTISYANNTNAGTATFTLTATTSGNYSGTKSVNFTINTVPLTITADNKSITYGSAVPTYTVSYNGFVGGEDATNLGDTLAFDCTYAQNSSVGDYTITPSGLTSSNYVITFETGTLTIGKRALSNVAIADIDSVTYSGAAYTPTPSVTDTGATLAASDYTVSHTNNTNAGTATVTLTAEEDGNYSGEATKTFTIAEKALTITADNKSIIYGDMAPAYTVSYSGFVEGEDASNLTGSLALNCDYEVNDAATTYEITPSGFTSNNYAITYTKGTLTVGKRTLSNVAIAEISAVTYSDAAHEPTPRVSDGTIPIDAASDYTISYASNTNAGEATITLTAKEDGNYSGTTTANFTINQKALTITAQDLGVAFGAAVPAQSDYAVLYAGFVGGQDASSLTGTLAFTCAYEADDPAGEYAIVPSGLSSSNYAITYVNGKLAVGKISQAALAITGAVSDGVYGDESFTLGTTGGTGSGAVTYVSSNAAVLSVSGDTITITGAGDATITATKSGGANYVDISATVDITIGKALLTVSSDNQTITYGDDAPAYTVSYSGFVNSENEDTIGLTGSPALSCDYNTDSDVGSYTITTAIGTLAADNYTFTTANGTLTVNKAAQAALAVNDPGERTYGDGAFTLATTGGSGTGEVTYVSGDTTVLSINGTTATILKAGTATVTATKAEDTNYIGIDSSAFTITVLPRDIANVAVTVSGTYTYTGAAQTPIYIVGDSGATITGYDYTAAYTGNTNAGTEATITLTGQGNYTGTKTAMFTIDKKALTVTADNQTITYGDDAPAYTVTYSGFVDGEDEDTIGLTGSPALTCDYSTDSDAGSYTITTAIGTLAANNYTFTTATGTLTVNKAAQAELAVATPAEKTYGDAAFTLTTTGGNGTGGVTYVSGNTTVLSISGTTATILKAGTATVTATKAGDTNYIGIDSSAFTITVLPRDIANVAVTVSGTYTYTGTAQTPIYIVGDSGATITGYDYTAAYSNNTNAGTEATITLTGQGNCTGTKTAMFTIDKKALTVTANNQTITYGDDAPAYTVTYSGFVDGEDKSVLTGEAVVSCSYKKGYNVGGYFIDVDASGLSAANYSITASSGRLQVEKTTGAAVSGAPAAAAKTTASITIATVVNASVEEQALLLEESEYAVQAVEYALNTSSAPPAIGWQDSTTFTDLSYATTYYAFARTAANINYDAGTVQMSEAIETDGKFTVTLSVHKDGGAYEAHGKTFYLKQGEDSFTGTGSDGTVTFAEIPEGATYNVYDGTADTGVSVAVDRADAAVALSYYTVTFGATDYGAAFKSTAKAVYGDTEITSGLAVLGGKDLTLTAIGKNASTYTYAWTVNGARGERTDSITISNLANAVNAVCVVTGTDESSYDDSSSSSSSASESSQEAQSSAVESSVVESSVVEESSVAESSVMESSAAESSVVESSVAEESSVVESSIAESSAVESSTSEAVSEAVIESESTVESTYASDDYDSYSYTDDTSEEESSGSGLISAVMDAIQVREVTEEAVAVVSEIFSSAKTPVGPAMELKVDIAVGAVVTGREILLTARGLKPFTDVKLTVYSEPQVLGIATADENGEASLWATLPEGLEQGAHTVVAEGIGTLEEPIQSVSMFQIDEQSVALELLPPSQLAKPVDPGDKTLVRAMEAGKPIYEPARNPGTVAGATVAICVTGGGFAAMAGLKKPGDNPPNRNERRRARGKGLGDRGPLWRILPFSKASDRFFVAAQEFTSKFSFTLHRMLTDGVWARAMFGSGGFLLWIAGAALGGYASVQVGFRALTPDFHLVLAIVALGLLDASAGFVSWLTMALCSLCTGHVTSLQDVCTLLGMFTLFTALMTLSSIRPLHREYEPGKKFIYDRIMDYIIPTVYLILSSSAVLDVINGLSGLELFSEENGTVIKIVSVLALWVRLAFEDIATNLFPERCHELHADTEFSQSPPFIVGSIALYITTFILISVPFFEFSSMLMILLALDMIPALAQYFEEKLPNSKFLNHWYPDPDSPYISLAMIVVDIYLTLWLLSGITDYRQMSVAMILLALPAAVAEIPALFGREGYVSKNKWTGRIAEFGCWAVFALIALDIVKLV